MAETPSTMLELGTRLPDFALPDPDGKRISAKDFAGQPLLIFFICNHCPFVKHIQDQLAKVTQQYAELGIQSVAINSNDVVAYPQDGPEQMKIVAEKVGFGFPYLFDSEQSVAKDFRASCTPEFFLFDATHRLVYRGQFDDSRPGNGLPVSGADLTRAVDNLLAGKAPVGNQRPSVGCSIKWKAGNAPDYFA